jgi:hypothetical protein
MTVSFASREPIIMDGIGGPEIALHHKADWSVPGKAKPATTLEQREPLQKRWRSDGPFPWELRRSPGWCDCFLGAF